MINNSTINLQKNKTESGYFAEPLVNSDRIIYTPSNFAKSNLTFLQEVGELTSLKRHTSERENLSSFLFFIVTNGSGTVYYGNATYEVNAGDCVFINCMNAYGHTSSANLWTLKWVHFYGTNMNAIYDKYKERGGKVVFKAPDPLIITTLIDEIHSIAESSSYLRDMEIHEKLSSLLLNIMKESWNKGISEDESEYSTEKRSDIRYIREFIEKHYNEDIKLDHLAETFNISKYYLSHIFKEQYGISVNSYVINMRITKAKHFLRFTDLTTTEIANRVGYEDVNYFIRTFKKIENITPGEYKKKW